MLVTGDLQRIQRRHARVRISRESEQSLLDCWRLVRSSLRFEQRTMRCGDIVSMIVERDVWYVLLEDVQANNVLMTARSLCLMSGESRFVFQTLIAENL